MPEPATPVQVSVAMATYNGERWLRPQLDSILASLREGDELVVVDDASTDGTWAMLRAIDDPRVRVERNAANLGVRRTFEKVLRMTRGRIVFLSDQDDLWAPDKRDTVVSEFAADPRCAVVVSDARVIDGDGRVTLESFMATRGGFAGSLAGTLVRNRFLGCAMAVRREVLDAALPIPERAPMHDMWIGAIATRVGTVRYVPRPLIDYRRHGGNVSPSRRQSIGRLLRWRVDLLVEVLRRERRLREARARQ